MTGIILVCHPPTTILFYLKSTYSCVSTYFYLILDILCESVDLPVHIFTVAGDSIVVDWVLYIVTLIGYDSRIFKGRIYGRL